MDFETLKNNLTPSSEDARIIISADSTGIAAISAFFTELFGSVDTVDIHRNAAYPAGAAFYQESDTEIIIQGHGSLPDLNDVQLTARFMLDVDQQIGFHLEIGETQE
ncbi:MAG: hypothetical protein JSW66_07815, partial [Phycisphaerales bacterium]